MSFQKLSQSLTIIASWMLSCLLCTFLAVSSIILAAYLHVRTDVSFVVSTITFTFGKNSCRFLSFQSLIGQKSSSCWSTPLEETVKVCRFMKKRLLQSSPSPAVRPLLWVCIPFLLVLLLMWGMWDHCYEYVSLSYLCCYWSEACEATVMSMYPFLTCAVTGVRHVRPLLWVCIPFLLVLLLVWGMWDHHYEYVSLSYLCCYWCEACETTVLSMYPFLTGAVTGVRHVRPPLWVCISFLLVLLLVWDHCYEYVSLSYLCCYWCEACETTVMSMYPFLTCAVTGVRHVRPLLWVCIPFLLVLLLVWDMCDHCYEYVSLSFLCCYWCEACVTTVISMYPFLTCAVTGVRHVRPLLWVCIPFLLVLLLVWGMWDHCYEYVSLSYLCCYWCETCEATVMSMYPFLTCAVTGVRHVRPPLWVCIPFLLVLLLVWGMWDHCFEYVSLSYWCCYWCEACETTVMSMYLFLTCAVTGVRPLLWVCIPFLLVLLLVWGMWDHCYEYVSLSYLCCYWCEACETTVMSMYPFLTGAVTGVRHVWPLLWVCIPFFLVLLLVWGMCDHCYQYVSLSYLCCYRCEACETTVMSMYPFLTCAVTGVRHVRPLLWVCIPFLLVLLLVWGMWDHRYEYVSLSYLCCYWCEACETTVISMYPFLTCAVTGVRHVRPLLSVCIPFLCCYWCEACETTVMSMYPFLTGAVTGVRHVRPPLWVCIPFLCCYWCVACETTVMSMYPFLTCAVTGVRHVRPLLWVCIPFLLVLLLVWDHCYEYVSLSYLCCYWCETTVMSMYPFLTCAVTGVMHVRPLLWVCIPFLLVLLLVWGM